MNKNYTLSLLMAVLTLGLKAQITFESGDLAGGNETFVQAYLDDESLSFDATQGRMDAIWDFSTFTHSEEDLESLRFEPADITAYSDSFPESNLALVQDENSIVYMTQTIDGSFWNGFAFEDMDTLQIIRFDDPLEYIQPPLTYGTKQSGTGSFSITQEFGEPPFSISFTSKNEQKRIINVNGYGTIKMNEAKSFDGLRLKITEIDRTETSVTSPVGTETSSQISYSYYYEFWSKEYGLPMARVEVDSADHSKMLSIEYLDLGKTFVGIDESPQEWSVYPNPVSDILTIKGDFTRGTIRLYNMSGKEVLVSHDNANRIDVSSLPAGIYHLRVSDTDGKQMDERVVIE